MPARKKATELYKNHSLKRSSFSKVQIAAFVLIFGSVGGYILWRGLAAPPPPTIYLLPTTQSFTTNTSFQVTIRENSSTTSINAVQANFTYDPTLVDFVSITPNNTTFSNVAQSTGGSGQVRFAAGVTCSTTCPAVTGDQLVATVNFKTKLVGGSTAMAFSTGTALVASSNNTNLLPSLASTGGSTFTVDTFPPTVNITSPTNGATIRYGTTQTVTTTATDAESSVTSVDVYVDSVLKTTLTTSPYNYSWNTTGLSLGSHTLQSRAKDTFNNLGSSPTITVTIADQTAPTVSLSAPANGSTIRGTNSVSATASDDIGVAGVQFKLDGANLGTEDTTSPYSISWDTTTATNGSHTLTAVARDAAGNTTTSSAVTTTVDNSAPTVSISAPASGATVKGTTVAVSATASDNIGVAGVQFKLDGVNLSAEDTTSPYGITWNTTTATEGSHTLTAVARDAVGNTTTSSSVTISVDNVAPTVSVTAPTAGSTVRGNAVTLSANASDAVGVSSVQFKVDGTNVGSADTTSPYSVTWDSTTATNATHAITAVATDGAGNTTTSSSVTVTVDNSAPTVNMTAPASGTTVKGTATTVSATASDNVGVAGVQFKIDGNNLSAEDTTSPYSISWNTTTIADGLHTLTAVARDAAGNTTTSASVSVTVDNAGPSVSISAPSAGATVLGTAVPVSATASDNVGVVGVQFRLDCPGTACGNLGAEDTTNPYSINWNTTTLANGTHTLSAIARDAAGNSTTSATVTVTVNNPPPPDTTPPSVPTGLASTGTTQTSISLTWNISTDSGGSGLAGYKLYRAGLFIAQVSTPGYTDTGLTVSTTYSYQISSIDNAGNESTKSTAVNIATADPPPPPIPGDLNLDGHVDVTDLSMMLSNYDNSGVGDIDGNGIVNVIDLSILLSNYGR